MSAPIRVIPHDDEAEAGVLGSILIDKEAILKVADLVTPEDFYRESHAAIFDAMLALYAKSEPIDLISLSDRLGDAMRINASGEAGNVPGKVVKSVWGSENQRDIMKAALGSQQMATSFEKLMGVLQAASRSLPEGSPTATNLAAQNAMMQPSKLARFAGKMTSPGTLLSAGEDLAAGISELRGPAKRIALAQYLLSDAGMEQLKRLTLLSPTSRAAHIIAGTARSMGITVEKN